jgi:hypothetical protein
MTGIDSDSTLVDVCFAVCSKLNEVGIVAVLTGGSAATFYVPERYQSLDADFVITMSPKSGVAAIALRSLNFEESAGVYRHPRTRYSLDFLAPPLAIGSEVLSSWETQHRNDGLLHVISRTDCVRDRLAAFYHWDDRSSLVTATAVAQSGSIDLDLIRQWSTREGEATKFGEFERQLEPES